LLVCQGIKNIHCVSTLISHNIMSNCLVACQVVVQIDDLISSFKELSAFAVLRY
jgi:hypothetical protein